MDSPARTFVKTCTWQLLGLISMVGLGYLVMGSVTMAGGFALASMALGTVSYVLHERVWQRIHWGRVGGQSGH